MRASSLFAAVVGAAAGFGGAVMFAPRVDERTLPSDAAPSRASDWLERLDAIDAKLANLALLAAPASAAAAPTRVAADDAVLSKVEERLEAIEAAFSQLAASIGASRNGRDDPPRAARDAALFDRLFEAEYAKRQVRRDDHLGYTADRLYERYGAPDYIHADSNNESRRMSWAYNDPNGSRGVIFRLLDGVVTDESAWMK